MVKAMLVDYTKCVGCQQCVAACKTKNGLLPLEPAEEPSAKSYTGVKQRNGLFVSRLCMHCQDPTCASVCPVGAFQKTAAGPVVYAKEKCIGCRYCILACPFDVPKYEWESRAPKVTKCTLCADLVAAGQQPACVQACPVGARIFGDREALLAEARARIQANGKKYVDQVYGAEEVGGTSVLLLSSVPFRSLGFREGLGRQPLPLLTWRALSEIPNVVTAGGALLFGIWWITNRRTMVAEERAREEAARRAAVAPETEDEDE
jgi:formate dehydrogenase iron-sulfur subunit